MAGAYTLYVQLQAGLSGLTTGLRGGAQQLRSFDGQLSSTRAELERMEAAAVRLGRAQAAAAEEAVASQEAVRAAVERSAAAQQAATATAERAGRAQVVAAQSAARAQAEQAAAIEATTRAARAQELAQTMAVRAQATTGAGAVAAQRTAAAAAESATRAGEAQVAQAARAAAAQEAAGRAAGLAERTSAGAAQAAASASSARAALASTEEQAARRAGTAAMELGRAQTEAAAAAQAATAARVSGLVKGGVLLGAILAAGLAGAMALEREMANVLTISQQINGKNIGAFTSEIIRLSTELPQTASQLAQGLYQIVSTGFDGAEAMDVLEVSAKGASAGLTTTETSARALLGVLKAYGMPASKASDVMDIMFQTVNKGVISFSELAQQLGDVVPMAAAAGIGFDDMSAALAAITLSGIPAAEAATSLNMLMTRLMKPTKDLSALIHGLGYESAASAVQQDGLYVVMGKITQATGGQAEATVNLFKDIRASRAALALAAADGQNYADTYKAITSAVDRADATQKAYAIQMNTTSGQFDLFKNRAAAAGMDVARILLPVLQELAQDASVVANAFNDLPGPVKSSIGVLVALGAVALVTRAGVAQLSSQLVAFRAATAEAQAGGAVLPALLRGTSLAVSGLTGILAIGVLGYAAYSASKQKAKAVTDDLTAALRAEREQHDVGAGMRALAESLANSDDMKKLKAAGLEMTEVIDGLMDGGDKLAKLNDKLDISKAASWDPNLMAYNTDFDKAKQILSQRRKTWDDAIKADSESAAAMDIVSAKIKGSVQANLAAWSPEQALPTDKNGNPQYSEQMKALGKAMGDIVQPAEAWKAAQDKVTASSRAGVTQIDLAKTSISGYIDTLSTQQKASKQFQTDLDELTTRGYGPLADHFAKLGDASAGMAHELVENLKAGKKGAADQLSDLTKVTKAGLDDYMAELQRQLQTQRDFQKNLSELAVSGHEDLVDHFAQLGVSSAGMLDELVQRIKSGHGQIADELSSVIEESTSRSTAAYRAGLEQVPLIAAKYGQDTARAWATAAETNDVVAFGKIMEQMAVTDMTNAARAGADASKTEMASGLDLVTQVAGAKGLDAAGAFSQALLAGDIDKAMDILKSIWGSKQPIDAPDLSAVIGAFHTAGGKANDEWSAMLTLIAQVSQAKGAAAAQALTAALLSGDMGAVQRQLDAIGASVRSIPGQKTINVNVNAPSRIDVPVVLTPQGAAGWNGGVGDSPFAARHANGHIVSYYADGGLRRGEQHVAQIAPAGTWRVWAEPETGGESYIPLAPAKRDRSKTILAETARRFGGTVLYGTGGHLHLADGGLVATRPAPPSRGLAKLVPARTSTTTVVVREGAAAPLVGSMPISVSGSNLTGEQVADAVMRRIRHLKRGGRA
ncbi:phage tail tape measure protein [Kitasatospora sp. NBC_01287]|uniref:phage tail tape measure protein n=1 Tax=Kitasatospora sp. NBC_01287 TaxID=2903573 RepID=UPI00225651FA|nr:phage tail tape measure protein [Kitasatospora sp. NBC_01287]MCX4749239.1 phage tail tape measure protein [Kitasatospora sp. NBC_01287]